MRKVWNKTDLIGQKFGKLTVIGRKITKCNHQLWECICECGKKTNAKTSPLRSGHKRSCGCLVRTRQWNWQGVGEISCSYYTILTRNAKSRELEFKLTLQEMWDLFLKQNRRCALTDIELTFTSNYRDYKKMQTASLDRIDSDKGYTIDNVQWVHKTINIIKRDINQDIFIDMCKKVAKKHET